MTLALLGLVVLAGLIFGVTMVLPIGGADMPVVISLLNSFTGTAAAMAGFVIGNPVLIIAGALVGASGAILTKLMADAMNRSVLNIMVGGFGGGDAAAGARRGAGGGASARSAPTTRRSSWPTPSSVIIVPGYGLAVAQAQHAVRELAELLEARGVDVKYAIHPVAGRMPGHMNVLLAEANVPYPQLKEMDEINPEFERADVALVVGANDVTNPAARSNPARRSRACRSSTSTTPSRSSSSSARWAAATPASTTSSTRTRRRGCSSPTRRTAWPQLVAAVKAV